MDKINGASIDIVADNIAKLKKIFPEVFCEDKVDFERLQEVLGNYIEDKEERYRFEWNGKSKAIRISQTPSTGTLRPCKEESKDWDTTQNLYIEGDNLEVLKLLQKSYQNKIKMIYIDPPYNTGKDFVYKDDFRDNLWNYLALTGQLDEEGKKNSTNSETSGRYHTDWLNMMYPRLRLSRNLLSDDGVIFISIGQDELHNIIKLCDELYGEENRIGIVSRLMKSGGNKGRFFSPNIDYIVIYARNITFTKDFKGEMSEELIKKVYNQVEKSGIRKGEYYRSMGLYQSSLDARPNQRYFIECPDGTLVVPPGETMPNNNNEGEKVIPKPTDGVWRWTYDRYYIEKAKGNVEFKETTNGVLIDKDGNPSKWNIYTKIWLKDRQDEGQTPVDIITKFENRHSAKELASISIPFDFAKPIGLIKYLIYILQQDKDSIILDFFSGSATTANAVMEQNVEDNGKRRFIMVQLPEKVNNKSDAYKAGFKNICEIGKERIRRAGERILEENSDKVGVSNLDTGFKVLKLDSSNIKKWNPEYDELEQSFDDMLENFIPNRSEEDGVYEIMLKYGIDLTYPVEERVINDKKVFSIGFGALIICLDDNISLDVVNGIVELKQELEPEICRVVFKDNGFATDSVKTNAIQILKRNNIKEVMSI